MDLDLNSTLTLIMVTAYCLLALVSIFQLVRIVYYRHPLKSFQAWFLVILLLWSVLRAAFFLGGQEMPDPVFTLVYWLPVDLQFMTFSLLVVFYAFLLHQAQWEQRRVLFFGAFAVVNVSVVAITSIYVALACRTGECILTTALNRMHHLFMASQFTVLVFVYGVYGWRLWRTSSDATALGFPAQTVPCSITFLTLGAWVVFVSRWIYNILVSIDQSRFAMTLEYGDDGLIDVHPKAFLLLVWWEIIPSLLVLVFFRSIPATPNGLCPGAFPCLNPRESRPYGTGALTLNMPGAGDDPLLLLAGGGGIDGGGDSSAPSPLAGSTSFGALPSSHLHHPVPAPPKRHICIFARCLPGFCITAPILGAVARALCCVPRGYAEALRQHRAYVRLHGSSHDDDDDDGGDGTGSGRGGMLDGEFTRGRGGSGSGVNGKGGKRGSGRSTGGVSSSGSVGGDERGTRQSISSRRDAFAPGGAGARTGDLYDPAAADPYGTYGGGLYYEFGANAGTFGAAGGYGAPVGFGGVDDYGHHHLGGGGDGGGGAGGNGVYAGSGALDPSAAAGGAGVGVAGLASPLRRVYSSPFYDADGYIGYGGYAGADDGSGAGAMGAGAGVAAAGGGYGQSEAPQAQVQYGAPRGAAGGRGGNPYQNYKY
jgi:hypothetical protein